jgi:hypothetical protein
MPKPTNNPFEDPEFKRYAAHVRDEVLPMMRRSHSGICRVPADAGDPSIQMATELGLMIMMDMPIIAVVEPGAQVPDKFVLVADEIVEGKPGDPGFPDRLNEAIERIKQKYNQR